MFGQRVSKKGIPLTETIG